MKNLSQYVDENLNIEQTKSLDRIIRFNNVDINKPLFFMARIPKKKEFHIYQCQEKEQLEQYYEKTLKEPLEFGRFQALSNDKEDLLKLTKFYTFKKEHYKIIEEH